MTAIAEPVRQKGWTLELFKGFWAAPSAQAIRRGAAALTTDDVVGVWPHGTVVRGREDYVEAIVRLLAAVPDFHAEVKEHAVAGEFTFVRWEATGTVAGERFVAIGTDRMRMRDGMVAENLIMSDHPVFRVVAPPASESAAL